MITVTSHCVLNVNIGDQNMSKRKKSNSVFHTFVHNKMGGRRLGFL